MLSVLIPAFNEANNIVECLESVDWADELVVVDSGSTDGTQALAQQCGARVVDFKWNGRLPKKKNWALQNIAWRNEWVLILDADERVTPRLTIEIQEELKKPSAAGYFLNRKFVFMGKQIYHCGYYPSWNLRLFRHAQGRYEAIETGDSRCGDNEVHEHVAFFGRTAYLREEMLHLAYPDIFTWIQKHNCYSEWEAQVELRRDLVRRNSGIGANLSRKRQLKIWSRRLPFRSTLRFWYSYLLRGGILDGYEGYVLCRLLATYEMLSGFKTQELRLRARSGRPTGMSLRSSNANRQRGE